MVARHTIRWIQELKCSVVIPYCFNIRFDIKWLSLEEKMTCVTTSLEVLTSIIISGNYILAARLPTLTLKYCWAFRTQLDTCDFTSSWQKFFLVEKITSTSSLGEEFQWGFQHMSQVVRDTATVGYAKRNLSSYFTDFFFKKPPCLKLT